MTTKELMAIVYVGKDVYVVDRKSYYLLCNLQKVDFEYYEKRYEMYIIVLDWMVENGKAIKLEGKPHHLIIKGEEE